MISEVYDVATDVLVEDLVFVAINKETRLTIEVPFCLLYPYEGEVTDICLNSFCYSREYQDVLPIGLSDCDFIWRLKRPNEKTSDVLPIKFLSASCTGDKRLMIVTTAGTKECDFRRLQQMFNNCCIEKYTVTEYHIAFEHGPKLNYSDFYRYEVRNDSKTNPKLSESINKSIAVQKLLIEGDSCGTIYERFENSEKCQIK